MNQSSIAASQIDQPPVIDGDLADWSQPATLVLSRDTAAYIATQPAGSPAARSSFAPPTTRRFAPPAA